ncbi:tRNA pseudouridine(55) synthase TruB [Phormidium sp. FACHB-1136]|uniref:tRNA pseudouridine(55) synthase TruB n=1 Tax=Phormidium sp. FACHB-1136 TaxID=2692848 RepID=UPI0016852A96|nr:tRNA pseudouridine(55) synthase TruB [Phormidium sp. FACHB-1136]
MDGFLNLNKPCQVTSHDCVATVRRLLGTPKVGHGGTLDPLAEGVLPLAVGRATRLLPYLAADKAYRAVIRFGLTTTTDDLEGDVLSHCLATDLTLETVQAALPEFVGTLAQVPPVFSAIQVQGKRLYDLARRGQVVTPPPRTVVIHRLTVQGWQPGDYPELTLTVDCGPGTYIRSLARDLGQQVGTGATLAHLTRTRSNGFDLASSLTLDQVKQQVESQTIQLHAPESALTHLPTLPLDTDLARRWQQGQKFPPPVPLEADQPYRILSAEGRDFLGIGQLEWRDGEPILKAKMVLKPWA